MGFNDIKAKILLCLSEGKIQHDMTRTGNLNEKNFLLTGQISVEAIIRLLKQSRGTEYESSPHHLDNRLMVHILKTKGWYIKFYFLDDAVFISVHPTKEF